MYILTDFDNVVNYYSGLLLLILPIRQTIARTDCLSNIRRSSELSRTLIPVILKMATVKYIGESPFAGINTRTHHESDFRYNFKYSMQLNYSDCIDRQSKDVLSE